MSLGSYRPPGHHGLRSRTGVSPTGAGRKPFFFRSESDVRAWVKSRTKDPFWIEPNRGSTVGVPDVFTLDAGGVWLELKHGICLDKCLLKWKPRPRQYWALNSIRLRGLQGALLVGFRNAIFTTSDPEILRRGWAEIRERDLLDPRDPDSWAKTLETIVSDCAETEKGVSEP